MALGFNTTTRDAWLNSIVSRAGTNAYIRIYNGTRPATGGAATTLLAELRGNATQFGTVSGQVLTLSAVTQDSSNDATGTATWFRVLASDGTTHVYDGDVGTSGSDLNLNSTSIVVGGTCSITSATITAPNP